MPWDEALAEWQDVLGDERVSVDTPVVERYARTTQPHGTTPRGVLYPRSVEEVQAVVRIAARHETPLYPISCGKNWGYGDACAPRDGAMIVDLRRMDRILEINPELGYAVIEPGVTQQQLYERVRVEAPGFWMDSTGAGPHASIVGNVLERGFGHTPYGDHVRTSCGMEIVLADGRVLNTGFGHFQESRAARVYPYGVGPVLDGLFTQSNLGIVTKLCVWLYPAPEAFRLFFIKVDREEQVYPLMEALRPLRMRGILNSAVHIGNDLRVITSLRRYPWDATGGKTPLPESVRESLRRETGLGAWNASGALMGTRSQVRGAVRELKKAVGPLGKLVFVDDRKLAWGKRAVMLLNKFGLGRVLAKQLEALEPNYGLLKGIPTDAPLLGAQWRLRTTGPVPLDPLEAGCGLIWFSPVLPMRAEDVKRLLECVTPLFYARGFDLPVTFTLLNERSMVAILNLAFDKSVPEDIEQASACYQEVTTALKEAGYPPYRLTPEGMPLWTDPGDSFWYAAQKIKSALDPQNILAPGRYVP
ncbi:MAG TPA: FAD-binding oxidoreductase [Candidatus Hydrogenedentes bacterium]|nr:FAD-binding oxidoreductase [Candidatus Hydrogenedentota bacterium]